MTTIPTSRVQLAQLELRLLGEYERAPVTPEEWRRAFVRLGLNRQPQECWWVLAYDAGLHLTTVVEIGRGDHTRVDLHIPTMLAAVLTTGCERFSIMHNHPSGDLTITDSDWQATATVMTAANACGLYFEDHVILTPQGGYLSMVDWGLLKPEPYGNDAVPATFG